MSDGSGRREPLDDAWAGAAADDQAERLAAVFGDPGPASGGELDDEAAERLLAAFRYRAGTGAPSNANGATVLPDNGRHRGRHRSGAGQDTGASRNNTANADAAAGTGPSVGPAEGRSTDVPEQLTRLLAAAAAPAHPHELRGYEAARRAFEAAGSATAAAAARSRGRHVVSGPLARIAGVKLAALAGALTVAGVAVAAEADVLPSPIQRAAHKVLGGVGVPDPEPEGQEPGATPVPGAPGGPGGPHTPHPSTPQPTTHTPNGQGPGGTGVTDTSTLPGAQTDTSATSDAIDLCRAYVAGSNGNGNGNGNGMPAGQRRKLAELAGGDKNIDAFCAQVLASAPPPTAAPAAPQPSSTPPGQTQPSSPASPSRTHPTHDPKPSPTTDPNGNGNGATGGASLVRKTH